MSGIDLGRLDDVMAAVSEVRERVGSPSRRLEPDDLQYEVQALADAVADLIDVTRDKLAELAAAADAVRGGGKG